MQTPRLEVLKAKTFLTRTYTRASTHIHAHIILHIEQMGERKNILALKKMASSLLE